MSQHTIYRVPQGLSGCGRYRALWSRAGGGLWLIFDTTRPITREPVPVATYRDTPGLTVADVLQVFALERVAQRREATRA